MKNSMFSTQRQLHILPKSMAALALASVSMQASTDYGPAIWNPISIYRTSGYGHKFLVIHDMEGFYGSLWGVANSKGGTHYGVNSGSGTSGFVPSYNKVLKDSDGKPPGEVTQLVRDAHYAIHARCWNYHSIGTEHEGFASNPAWFTEAQYVASASLQKNLCNKFGLPKDRNHIVGHGEKSNAAWRTWATANLGIDPSCNTHTDPGVYWDWTHFMDLINGGGPPPPPATINPPYVFDADTQGWTTGNGLSAMAWTATGWPGIIYSDQVGNDAFMYSPAASFGGNWDECVNVSFYPQSGNTANHDMQVFWKTAQDNTWTGTKQSPIVSYSSQNAWTVLAFDVNSANWAGKDINQFRLDFDNNNSATRWIVNHVLKQASPRSYFNANTEGWTAGGAGMTAPVWTGGGWPGIIYSDQIANDAFLIKTVSPAYRGASNDRIEVRVYPQGGSTVNHDMQIFWATAADPVYSAAKSTPIANYAAKDGWISLFFDVGANANWSGYTGQDITGLRVDFDQVNHANRWIVDYVRILHDANPVANKINNAAIVSITAPATVNAGAPFSATVTMNNAGSKTWSADATPHNLGSQSPNDNTTWGLTRAGLPGGASVAPGANVTFTINATAPATLGTYSFDWGMVEDGVQWFGPIAQATITVINSAPAAPSSLAGSAVSYSQINLTWVDNATTESGFKVERSTDNVNFTQIAAIGANATSYSSAGLTAGTTYYHRVRSYNSGANSAYSNTATTTTPSQPPVLGVIGGKTGTEGQQLTFTASSSNPNALVTTTTWQNYESFADNTANGTVMFRQPVYSGSTSAFLDTTVTNYTSVKSSFPAGGANGSKVMKTSWSFKTGTTNPWLRLTTAAVANIPNPTIDLDHVLKFDIYTDKSLKVAFTARETGTAAAYGADGGSTGGVEFVGVTGTTGGQPQATRTVNASAWTTLSFNLPFEGAANFTGGNGVLSSGIKGVLEQLSLVPNGGMGVYTIHVDNFAVVVTNNLTYSLDAGAPAGATIGLKNGVFSWTPSAGQAGNHTITVRVTDRLGLTDFETIAVSIIAAGNHRPVLAAIGNKTVDENTALQFTASATDQDAGQTKTFTLDAGNPAGSSITTGGAFTWTPTEAQGTGGTYPITVRVTDNGAPASNDFETIIVTVNEVNVAPTLATIADQTINEGSALSATAVGSDTDLPGNSLTYSLDAGSPVGMTINSGNGAIAWTTGESHGPATYPVTARVTDAGGLSGAATFNVTVNEANIAPALTVNTTLTSVQAITDFEGSDTNAYIGTVMFRQPSFSSSSSAFIDTTATNYTKVTVSYPGGDGINKVVQATWSFKTGTTNPWMRLATGNTLTIPNPTVNFTQRVRFKIYTDKNLGVALGLRETDTTAAIGQNGGASGTVEWAGATSTAGAPVPSRVISAATWTTLEFNLPSETITAYTGNGVLASTTGKGVLEHLVLTPSGGMGAYNVYLDNFEVVTVTTNLTVNTDQSITFTSSATDADFPAQTLTYSLDSGAPAGTLINSATGDFSWTPTSAQGPSTNVITVRVTDNGPGNLSAAQNVTIVVNKVNTAPVLEAIFEQGEAITNGVSQVIVYHEFDGNPINIPFSAIDSDLPANTLTFSLQGTPPSGATIGSSSGLLAWTPPNALTTNVITVRVTDNGVPALYAENTFTLIVTPINAEPVLSLGTARITERFVGFETFTNNTPNGTIMFRQPIFSGSSSLHIDSAVTNYTRVTTSFPAGNPNGSGSKVMITSMSFKTGTTNPWVRLITIGAASVVNPTIDLTARVKFDVYSSGKAIKVGLAARETATSAAIGADGGSTGGIEWLGCTKFSNGSPNPSRTVNADVWTTLEFNLPAEYCTNFSSGNSVLAGGKGVLEHLAIVPAGTLGVYTIYVDNFEVVSTPALPSTISMNVNSTLTFTAGATDSDPGSGLNYGLATDSTAAGSSINSGSGAFTWTPAAAGTFTVIPYVNDNPTNGAVAKVAQSSFDVTVNTDPLAPYGANGPGLVAAGESVSISWDSVAGEKYKVQFRDADGADWTDAGSVSATDVTTAITVVNDGGARHYRVIAVDGADQ